MHPPVLLEARRAPSCNASDSLPKTQSSSSLCNSSNTGGGGEPIKACLEGGGGGGDGGRGTGYRKLSVLVDEVIPRIAVVSPGIAEIVPSDYRLILTSV